MEHKFHWEVLRKMGLPFQKFCLFRIISSGTSQKVVFHLHPKRDFQNFLVNGKRSMKHLIYQVLVLYRTVRTVQESLHMYIHILHRNVCTIRDKKCKGFLLASHLFLIPHTLGQPPYLPPHNNHLKNL